jgi:hypothetical protein
MPSGAPVTIARMSEAKQDSQGHDRAQLLDYIESVRQLAEEGRGHGDAGLIEQEVTALEAELAKLDEQLRR